MSQDSINAENPLEEQLVAYLDGELDVESSRRIEERLAVDPEIRGKLHSLEQTWEMLDKLDTTPVSEDFTRTTLEMVAIAAEQDVQKNLDEAPRRRRRLWMPAVAGLLLAGLAGFMVASLAAPSRIANRQLLEELPILENLDKYRQIKNMEFLRLLQKEKLFADEEYDAKTRQVAAQSEESVIQKIETLGPSEKYELSRKQKRLSEFDPAEQQALRQLHEQIQKDAQSGELRGIMDRYYDWYKSLPTYNRPDLTQSPAERIDWIKKHLLAEQSKITTKPPTAKDAERLWKWMEEYAAGREKSLIEEMPQSMKQRFSGFSADLRRPVIMWMMWQRPPGGQNRSNQLSDGDLDDLLDRFTPETKKMLEAKSPADRLRTVQSWAQRLLHQNRQAGFDKLLADFFENKLDDEQRDRLMNLSGEEMKRELVRMFFMQNRPQGPPDDGRGPDGPPPDRP
jgi:hypothetical protein